MRINSEFIKEDKVKGFQSPLTSFVEIPVLSFSNQAKVKIGTIDLVKSNEYYTPIQLGSAELILSHRQRVADVDPHSDDNDEKPPDFGQGKTKFPQELHHVFDEVAHSRPASCCLWKLGSYVILVTDMNREHPSYRQTYDTAPNHHNGRIL